MRQAEFPLVLNSKDTGPEVPGFLLRENYLAEEEESHFLDRVAEGPWESDWKRRIQQFGLGYARKHGGQPEWVRDFPDWLRELGTRVAEDAGFDREPENCVINEYVPPQGIAPHSDYPAFGPRIACVSLGSGVVLDLIHSDKSLRVPVHVPARSLWVLSGEARTQWQHGIAPRLSDVIDGMRRPRQRRVSITFRTAAREDHRGHVVEE